MRTARTADAPAAATRPPRGPRAAGRAQAARAAGEGVPAPVLTPIAVEVAGELGALLGPRWPGDAGAFAAEVVPQLRERLFAELGLPLPVVRLRAAVRRAWRRRRSSSA